MPAFPFWIFPAFFLTALVYAIVGFGGGSSYLAFLAMTSLPLSDVTAIALFCNLVVASGGVWHFSKAGEMRVRLLMPFLVTSIPASYFGGLLKTEDSLHRLLLGGCLLLVAWRIWIGSSSPARITRKAAGAFFTLSALLAGGVLGFLSGFLGIGGGIFLSPLLIIAGWANARESSAAASLFILLNSIAGLLARRDLFQANLNECLVLGLVVFFGGQIGSISGAYRFPDTLLRRILAAFISWVSFRLLWVAL